MKSLRDNHTWDLVELPRDRKTVGSKWIYKVEIKADRSIERYKARLVAQGYTQKFGVDYDGTFCPVVRMESYRVILASAILKDLKLHQIELQQHFLMLNLRRGVHETASRIYLERTRRSSLQAKQEYLWIKPISTMLEHCITQKA